MPRGDGTGPMGMGPMTGRAAGFCAGYGMPGYMNPVPGRGMGAAYGYAYRPAWAAGYGAVPRFGWGIGRGRGLGLGWGRGRGRGRAMMGFYPGYGW